jgi:hypothetical protein
MALLLPAVDMTAVRAALLVDERLLELKALARVGVGGGKVLPPTRVC